MNPVHYLVLAFVQAATEFLPISSSGHLLFLKGLFQVQDLPILFDIIIHVGSLTAIIVFYHRRLAFTVQNAWFELIEKRQKKPQFKLLVYICISTGVTFAFYLLFKESIESRYNSPSVLFTTYIVTTCILLSTYFTRRIETTSITNKSLILPFVVGLFQGIAIMPGISRSGSTISPLLLMGIKKEEAAYYSFFLAIPAILGALVFKLSEMEGVTFLINNWPIMSVTFVVSALFSYAFLALLTFILKKGKFWFFAIYTLGLAFLSLVLF